MPELPDLEAIKGFLQPKLAGVKIERIEVLQPVVIRQPSASEFISIITGNAFPEITYHKLTVTETRLTLVRL